MGGGGGGGGRRRKEEEGGGRRIIRIQRNHSEREAHMIQRPLSSDLEQRVGDIIDLVPIIDVGLYNDVL